MNFTAWVISCRPVWRITESATRPRLSSTRESFDSLLTVLVVHLANFA